MQLKQLFADEGAVSPVIGVILMVAITVILAAVIGTFVLGLGENVQNDSPQANFQFEYPSGDYSDSDATDGDQIEIAHNGGDNIERSNLKINVGGAETTDLTASGDSVKSSNFETTVSTGQSLTMEEDGTTAFEQNDDVRIIWTSPSGGSSSTIGSSTVPA